MYKHEYAVFFAFFVCFLLECGESFPLFFNSKSLTRFIIFNCRVNSNWDAHQLSVTNKSEDTSPTSTKKQRDNGDQSARDSMAYSCLLKNEILGYGIDDVKSVVDENVTSSAKRGLFKYLSPTKQVIDWVILATSVSFLFAFFY